MPLLGKQAWLAVITLHAGVFPILLTPLLSQHTKSILSVMVTQAEEAREIDGRVWGRTKAVICQGLHLISFLKMNLGSKTSLCFTDEETEAPVAKEVICPRSYS